MYITVSVSPTTSKIFERLMQKQIIKNIRQFLSPFPYGYRKEFSTQTTLVRLIEEWKHQLDKYGFAGTVLMYLSKAFDIINYDFLIVKLHAYGLGKNVLDLVYCYLKNRKQKVKINTTFSIWTDKICGVPQGSVLGPLLFDIYN